MIKYSYNIYLFVHTSINIIPPPPKISSSMVDMLCNQACWLDKNNMANNIIIYGYNGSSLSGTMHNTVVTKSHM